MRGRGDHPDKVMECPKHGSVTRQACWDGFVEAHAPRKRDHACWRCPVGVWRRLVAGSGGRAPSAEIHEAATDYYCRPNAPRAEAVVGRWFEGDA